MAASREHSRNVNRSHCVKRGTRRSRGVAQKYSVGILGGLLIGGLALNAIGAGLVSISPSDRGLVLNLFTGSRPPALEPGVHFVTPGIERVKYYSIGQETYTMSKTPAEGEVKGDDSVTARTSDGQEVFIDARSPIASTRRG